MVPEENSDLSAGQEGKDTLIENHVDRGKDCGFYFPWDRESLKQFKHGDNAIRFPDLQILPRHSE